MKAENLHSLISKLPVRQVTEWARACVIEPVSKLPVRQVTLEYIDA